MKIMTNDNSGNNNWIKRCFGNMKIMSNNDSGK